MTKEVIGGIIRNVIEELLKGPLEEMRADMRLLKEYAERHALRIEQTNQRIDALGGRLDARLDETNQRIDETNQRLEALGGRLDARIDETNQRLEALGGRLDARLDEMIREQSRLAEEVARLKTDKALTGDVLHRLERIEDKVLA